jgi:hypothetical protein
VVVRTRVAAARLFALDPVGQPLGAAFDRPPSLGDLAFVSIARHVVVRLGVVGELRGDGRVVRVELAERRRHGVERALAELRVAGDHVREGVGLGPAGVDVVAAVAVERPTADVVEDLLPVAGVEVVRVGRDARDPVAQAGHVVLGEVQPRVPLFSRERHVGQHDPTIRVRGQLRVRVATGEQRCRPRRAGGG